MEAYVPLEVALLIININDVLALACNARSRRGLIFDDDSGKPSSARRSVFSHFPVAINTKAKRNDRRRPREKFTIPRPKSVGGSSTVLTCRSVAKIGSASYSVRVAGRSRIQIYEAWLERRCGEPRP